MNYGLLLASIVMRFRGHVSRSCAFLAGDCARRMLVVCFECAVYNVGLHVYGFWVSFPHKVDHVFPSKLNTMMSSSAACSRKNW
jgi:hypothetical protein